MRACLVILLFIYPAASLAQDKASLDKAGAALNEAMVSKDSLNLKKLLHEHLSYGHSNGWVETRQELIANLYNGKLTYNTIKQTREETAIVDGTATVRNIADIDVLLDGKQMNFRLQVLQVWVWNKKSWRLLGRQSVKM